MNQLLRCPSCLPATAVNRSQEQSAEQTNASRNTVRWDSEEFPGVFPTCQRRQPRAYTRDLPGLSPDTSCHGCSKQLPEQAAATETKGPPCAAEAGLPGRWLFTQGQLAWTAVSIWQRGDSFRPHSQWLMEEGRWWQRLQGSLGRQLPRPPLLPAQDLFSTLSPNFLSNLKRGEKDQRLRQVWQAWRQGFVSTQEIGI